MVPRRRKGLIAKEVWQKVLQDLKSLSPPTPLTLCLHGAGEPLLHPALPEILKKAVQIPHLRVGFMTNAMLLDEDWAKFLVDLPVAWVAFSVDGVKAQTNDKIRRGAKLEIVEENIRRLISYRARKGSPYPELTFNMVAYPHVTEEEIWAYVRKWAPYASQVLISRFRPLSSKRLLREEEKGRLKPRACVLPFRQMVIAWDGRVGLCCEDIFLEHQLGEVMKAPLLEIFNNKAYQMVRRLHEKGHREKIPLCRECDVWAAEEVFKEEQLSLGNIKLRALYRPSGVLWQRVVN